MLVSFLDSPFLEAFSTSGDMFAAQSILGQKLHQIILMEALFMVFIAILCLRQMEENLSLVAIKIRLGAVLAIETYHLVRVLITREDYR